MSERALSLGARLRRQGFPTWVAHVINAAAAIAGDDSPSQQYTEMMSYVCVCQAYNCGVPNMVMNVQANRKWKG